MGLLAATAGMHTLISVYAIICNFKEFVSCHKMPLLRYLQGLAEPQPVQQAFDFHTGTASGPYVGLTAEPLKLESSSVGGVDSRVSSVGGAAAYNPPGAYNPGAAGACGSTGGAPGLRRMSSSRKFSRQGSRMRQSAGRFIPILALPQFV